MEVKATKNLQDVIIKRMTEPANPDNPLVVDNGETFLRYDTIVFKIHKDRIEVTYEYKGEMMCQMEQPLSPGTYDTMTFSGLRGMLPLTITQPG